MRPTSTDRPLRIITNFATVARAFSGTLPLGSRRPMPAFEPVTDRIRPSGSPAVCANS